MYDRTWFQYLCGNNSITLRNEAECYSKPSASIYGSTRCQNSEVDRQINTSHASLTSIFFCGAATQRGSWPPLDEWSARRRDLYLTTHNTHNRQTSMPPVGFEPTISAGERPQTYALDRAATGTDILYIYIYIYIKSNFSHSPFTYFLTILTILYVIINYKRMEKLY